MKNRPRGPDDPLMDELRKLAGQYGDQELLRVCLTVVQKYAELGAQKALVDRRGDKNTACPVCRERKAQLAQLEDTMRRAQASDRPIGADNSSPEG